MEVKYIGILLILAGCLLIGETGTSLMVSLGLIGGGGLLAVMS